MIVTFEYDFKNGCSMLKAIDPAVQVLEYSKNYVKFKRFGKVYKINFWIERPNKSRG